MNFSNTILTASLFLASTLSAQVWTTNTFNTSGTTSGPVSSTQSDHRGGNYDRSIGNSYLGGAVHAHMHLYSATGSNFERGTLDAQCKATVRFLNQSATIAQVDSDLTNRIDSGTNQTTSGSFKVKVLGATYLSRSFVRDENITQRNWTFNAFPVAPSLTIPVGPVSLTLRGNIGAGLSARANLILPAAQAHVGAFGEVSSYATGDAYVGAGVPGFSVGAGIEGRVLDGRLILFGGVNVRTGFYGTSSFSLTALSVRFYAYAEAFWQRWTRTLATWTTPSIRVNLF